MPLPAVLALPSAPPGRCQWLHQLRWCAAPCRCHRHFLQRSAARPISDHLSSPVCVLPQTPLCYVLPCYLYMLARGRQDLGPAAYWGLAALAITFAGVGTLAAIGSVRSIVLSIQQHDFFS